MRTTPFPIPYSLFPVLFLSANVAWADASTHTLLVVDRDDDDANQVPDGDQPNVAASAELLSVARWRGAPTSTESLQVKLPAGIRLLADGKPITRWSAMAARAKRLEVQAIAAGRSEVEILGKTLKLSAFEIRAIDGAGKPVDLARSHASLQRTPPDRLSDDPLADTGDPDAIRFMLIGVADDLPTTVDLVSVDPSSAIVDSLRGVALGHVACPSDVASGLVCGSTKPIRAVADDIDRKHPMVVDRSIKAQLGGALVVTTSEGAKWQAIRVGGPRVTLLGPIERYRAQLRVVMVRIRPGGPPPIGGDDAGAMATIKAEVERANALWGACGITFGPVAELDAKIVDPPRRHLLAMGCDHGLPASGGQIHVRVDGHNITAKIERGMRPNAAARVVADAISAAGFDVRVSDNPVIGAGAYGSSDVLVRRSGGALAEIDPPTSGTISSDATLTACIGQVDLEDGLQHFGDIDAIAGTVEERTLLKAFDDANPATIDVVMVPSFAGGGRIGESFISADKGAIRNTIIEDRAGLRADRASFALSHELGHVLLDEPGHPDDFGVDTPTRLMDADAANASAFGPRRLLVEECVRAIKQSGPGASPQLLTPWPLVPLGHER